MVSNTLPVESEVTLAVMAFSGVVTWLSFNILNNRNLTGIFASIGIISAIILIVQIM